MDTDQADRLPRPDRDLVARLVGAGRLGRGALSRALDSWSAAGTPFVAAPRPRRSRL